MLFSRRVSCVNRHTSAQSGGSAPLGGGACDALADGNCLCSLLITGGRDCYSHPRFYWGEVGNVNTKPLFTLPIPSSRGTVPTGYGYVMPDQNGWSRYLHFEAAWVWC